MTKLWTVVFYDDGTVADAFDQSDPGCLGGPDLCGGCRNCLVQLAERYGMRVERDVPDERMRELGMED
jgi:hypothetical protein